MIQALTLQVSSDNIIGFVRVNIRDLKYNEENDAWYSIMNPKEEARLRGASLHLVIKKVESHSKLWKSMKGDEMQCEIGKGGILSKRLQQEWKARHLSAPYFRETSPAETRASEAPADQGIACALQESLNINTDIASLLTAPLATTLGTEAKPED